VHNLSNTYLWFCRARNVLAVSKSNYTYSHGREVVRGGDSFLGPYLAFDTVTFVEEIQRWCFCKTGSEP